VVIVVVDPTHRVLKLGTNASQVRDSTIHPTRNGVVVVEPLECSNVLRRCAGMSSVASGMVMLVSAIVDGLRPCWPSSRNALVSSALGSEHSDCARFVDTVTVSTRCATVLRLCNLPLEKLRGRK